MSTINKIEGKTLMMTKGAPDVLFNRCSHALDSGKVVPINENIINEYKKINEEFSNKALRVLAFAIKEVDESFEPSIEDENNMTLVGLMAMIDPPREEVYSLGAPHSSTLAWKIPWTEESGRLRSMGWLRVRHD